MGNYVRERHATITAFYVSNVEFYLFRQGDDWKKFYANVATLPLDESSAFIRSLSQGFGFRPGSPNGQQVELLCSMQGLLKAYNEGKISYYYGYDQPLQVGMVLLQRRGNCNDVRRQLSEAVV